MMVFESRKLPKSLIAIISYFNTNDIDAGLINGMKSSLTTEVLADKAGADELLADGIRADEALANMMSAIDSEKGMPDNAPGGKTIAIFNMSVPLIRRCLECLD
jgi:hypothetical protein